MGISWIAAGMNIVLLRTSSTITCLIILIHMYSFLHVTSEQSLYTTLYAINMNDGKHNTNCKLHETG